MLNGKQSSVRFECQWWKEMWEMIISMMHQPNKKVANTYVEKYDSWTNDD